MRFGKKKCMGTLGGHRGHLKEVWEVYGGASLGGRIWEVWEVYGHHMGVIGGCYVGPPNR